MKSLSIIFLLFLLFNPLIFAQSSSASSLITIEPTHTLPVKTYPVPEFDFIPPVNLRYAGDINGDGIMDFYEIRSGFNQETLQIDDYVTKTAYWYGREELSLYPDKVDFEYAMPIGDLNGDRENDKIVYEDTSSSGSRKFVGKLVVSGEELISFEAFSSTSFIKTLSYQDIDGNGFDDVIIYNFNVSSDDQPSISYIIWGAANSSDIRLEKINFEELDSLKRVQKIQSIFLIDLDSDGNKELISIFLTDADFGQDLGVSIYQLNEEKELNPVQTFKVPSLNLNTNNMTAFVYDYDTDGEQDFFISSDKGTFKIDGGDEKGEILEDDNFVINTRNQPLFYTEFLVEIGDFDGNGTPDFLKIPTLRNEYIVEIIELSDSAEFVNKVPVYEGERFRNEIQINLHNPSQKIDLNKDGYADFIYGFGYQQNDSLVAKRLILGSPDRNNFETKEASFTTEFDYAAVTNTYNAGDINNDGIDDIAVLKRSDFFESSLEIFFGGKDSFGSPDLVIESDKDDYFEQFVTGDFNNDSIQDILLLNVKYVLTVIGPIYKAEILFFSNLAEGETSPEKIISYDQITGEELDLFKGTSFNIFYANDINQDSIDDLFVTINQKPDSYLLFGGNDPFTKTPLIIPFYANTFTFIGDIDDNGVNNFALANTSYNDLVDSVFVSGKIRLFSTFDEGIAAFDPENYIDLTIPTIDSEQNISSNFGYFLSSGDLNGDTFPDLMIGAYEHINQDSQNGSDAIYIYYGGKSFTSNYDFSFPIPLFDSNTIIDQKYLATSSQKYITTIPDIDQNGTDEILFLSLQNSFYYKTKTLIFQGTTSDSINFTSPIILKSPFEGAGLGTENNQLSVGEFNSKAGVDIVLRQRGDYRNLSEPIYLFEVERILTPIEEISSEVVSSIKLNQNYPNPFNPTTEISFNLPSSTQASLSVFNILGQKVVEIVNEKLTQGSHVYTFDASNLASGVYIYQLITPDFSESKKMLLIK